jgi:hypothetical protein
MLFPTEENEMVLACARPDRPTSMSPMSINFGLRSMMISLTSHHPVVNSITTGTPGHFTLPNPMCAAAPRLRTLRRWISG